MAIGGLDVEIDGLNIRVEEGSSCPSIGVLKRRLGPRSRGGGSSVTNGVEESGCYSQMVGVTEVCCDGGGRCLERCRGASS